MNGESGNLRLTRRKQVITMESIDRPVVYIKPGDRLVVVSDAGKCYQGTTVRLECTKSGNIKVKSK